MKLGLIKPRGHNRILTPLSPILTPRKPPAAGWRISCLCGWSEEASFPRRLEAEKAYADHRASLIWRCSACKNESPDRKRSKGSPHICTTCATAKVRAWAKENPSQWERSKRASHLRKKYGITIEQYEKMVADQGGRCAICETEFGDPRGYRPHIDHDHETGAVRSILCGKCNTGLGVFNDDPDRLTAAIAYLQRHGQSS